MDHSDYNWKAAWVFAVVIYLHKGVFKRPILMEWKGAYTRWELSYMLQGRVLWLWAPMQSGKRTINSSIIRGPKGCTKIIALLHKIRSACCRRRPTTQASAKVEKQKVFTSVHGKA